MMAEEFQLFPINFCGFGFPDSRLRGNDGGEVSVISDKFLQFPDLDSRFRGNDGGGVSVISDKFPWLWILAFAGMTADGFCFF